MRLYRKTSRRSRVAVFCLALVFVIGGLWWISRLSTGWSGRIALALTSPLRYVIERVYVLTRATRGSFESRQSLVTEIRQLQEENNRLRAHVGDNEALGAEVRTLREAVRDPIAQGEKRIVAHVSGKGAHAFGQMLLIDRGSDSGVAVGDVIIAGSRQVVGLVERVGKKYAWVKLLGHREFRAAAKIADLETENWKSRRKVGIPTSLDQSYEASGLETMLAQGLVRGKGFGNVVLEMVPADALLKEGDLVLTADFDGPFPPNLIVGKVLRVVSTPSDFFQKAKIAPAVDVGELEVVTILSKSQ